MDHASPMYRFVRFANSLLFAAAMVLLLDQSVASAYSRFEQLPHWHSDDRTLVVVDKTGDKAWHAATKHAVNAWNKVATGTELKLSWTTGTGPCESGGSRIEVCQEPYQELGDEIHADRQGLVELKLGSDRNQAHIGATEITVCSNCRLDAARRRVVATHELGHSLGLEHTPRAASVMYPRGGPDRPDPQDVSDLRQLYGHADTEDKCGMFDLEIGPLCF